MLTKQIYENLVMIKLDKSKNSNKSVIFLHIPKVGGTTIPTEDYIH